MKKVCNQDATRIKLINCSNRPPVLKLNQNGLIMFMWAPVLKLTQNGLILKNELLLQYFSKGAHFSG